MQIGIIGLIGLTGPKSVKNAHWEQGGLTNPIKAHWNLKRAHYRLKGVFWTETGSLTDWAHESQKGSKGSLDSKSTKCRAI